jgi:hypothetical protein
MSLVYLPIASAYGQNVKPFNGAKLYFYEVGTTTLKTVYSNKAETVALPNPVIADGNGRFPAMYISGLYKNVLTDNADSPIWTEDDLQGRSGDLIWGGDFNSSTNSGDYPSSGNQGDWYRVSAGFTLNSTSGGYRLQTADFIICNKDGATGIDADWDIIRGTQTYKSANISYRNLIAKYVSATTCDVDADSLTMLDPNNYPLTVDNINVTLDITSDIHAGSEKASTWYQIWITANAAGTIAGKLVPDLSSTADADVLNSLSDSAATFVTDKVQPGDRIYNTTDNTVGYVKAVSSETVLTCKDSAGADLDLFPDGNENYVIHILSPTLDSGYTYKANIGAVYNDSGSDFDEFTQNNNRVTIDETQVLNAGTATSPTAISIATAIPITSLHFSGWYTILEANGAAVNLLLTPTADATYGKKIYGFSSSPADNDPAIRAEIEMFLLERQRIYYDIVSGDNASVYVTSYEI